MIWNQGPGSWGQAIIFLLPTICFVLGAQAGNFNFFKIKRNQIYRIIYRFVNIGRFFYFFYFFYHSVIYMAHVIQLFFPRTYILERVRIYAYRSSRYLAKVQQVSVPYILYIYIYVIFLSKNKYNKTKLCFTG